MDSRRAGRRRQRPAARPNPIPITPAKLGQDHETRQLPSSVEQLCVGGGGRYLFLHLPKQRQIAVFDFSEAKIVKYIPAGEDSVKFAAGMNHLVVALPNANALQSYNLKTFERDKTVPSPLKAQVNGVLLGSGSNGPVVLQSKPENVGTAEGALLDPRTLQPIKVDGTNALVHGGFSRSYRTVWRVSGDGRMFARYQPNLSPMGHTIYHLTRRVKQHSVDSIDGHHAGSEAAMSTPLAAYSPARQAGGQAGFLFQRPLLRYPAAEGSFYVNIDVEVSPRRENKSKLEICVPGDARPIAVLSQVEVPTGINTWDREPFSNDLRFHFVPSAKLLVVLPKTNDRLELYKVDIDQILQKSDVDFLFVTSRAPAYAKKGGTYGYVVQARSRKGGLKYKVESGPEGMKVGNDGRVSWAVPADFADREVNVILAVSDRSDQELFHTFSVRCSLGRPFAALPRILTLGESSHAHSSHLPAVHQLQRGRHTGGQSDQVQ